MAYEKETEDYMAHGQEVSNLNGEINELTAKLEKLGNAVLNIDHKPGYDWNADPLNLTLLIGLVHELRRPN